ncbi:hypothetical protein LTS18_009775 [Coniosporium uncinatum]|uniref:Uncharacterized protein n=1 Tax=Coniosporium uncinatum TaxID=93489 RepID=A0ACC3D0Q3_9PEZI|nr:hypothetical protein LTS18_009775 [Coniosporium uncinatum]
MVWPVVVKPTSSYYTSDGAGHIFNPDMLLDANIPGVDSYLTSGAKEEPVPIWVDIHGQLIPYMFVKTMVGIIQQCALFGVTSTKELRRAFKYALDIWELDVAVRYLVDLGALRKTGPSVGNAGGAADGFNNKDTAREQAFSFAAAEAWYVCLDRLYGIWSPTPANGHAPTTQVPRQKVKGASAITVREDEWRGGSAGAEVGESGAEGNSKGKRAKRTRKASRKKAESNTGLDGAFDEVGDIDVDDFDVDEDRVGDVGVGADGFGDADSEME